jgi:hypothetical protein
MGGTQQPGVPLRRGVLLLALHRTASLSSVTRNLLRSVGVVFGICIRS